MQAVKVSWVGQTFALAKCSDSQGKKPRSRRTKEERRKMVETFIKKYQTSNNGSFPSLNLTHKEVGGSFYKVREIVRDIIQENRVLGPASSSPEKLSVDHFSEEPESYLSLSSTFGHAIGQGQKETIFISKEQYNIADGPFTTSNGQSIHRCNEMDESDGQETLEYHSNNIFIPQLTHAESTGDLQQNSDNGRYLNDNKYEARNPSEQGDIKTQSDELICTQIGVSKNVEGTEHFRESANDRVAPTLYNGEDFKYCKDKNETLSQQYDGIPVNPGSDMQPSNGLYPHEHSHIEGCDVCISENQTELHHTLSVNSPLYVSTRNGNKIGKQRPLKAEDLSLPLNSGSILSGMDSPESLSGSVVDEKVMVNIANPVLENLACPSHSRSPTREISTHDINKLSEVELPPTLAPNDQQMETVIADSDKAHGESLFPDIIEAAQIEVKAEIEQNNTIESGTNSIVDDGLTSGLSGKPGKASSTEQSAKTETNPVLVVIKSFIAAFLKFWME
ncbi:DNA binding protein isoform X2 [Tasmannia lanceolata]|uniref:DNA binding protein isoform X2 n=1 Tax=Tasmannia lanceolata TaxID=3420 RepID=UPI00406436A2